MQQEIEYLIQQILTHEMDLPNNYGTQEGKIIPCVYVVAPNVYTGYTDNLQIGIQSFNSKIIANTKWFDNSTLTEHTQQIIDDEIQIDIFSRNNDARIRRYEVLSALTSYYSQQQQEKYQFKIYNIPRRIINTSRAEGAATIYRYTLTISTQYCKEWTRQVDYFNTFPTNITTEGTITDVSNFTVIEEN